MLRLECDGVRRQLVGDGLNLGLQDFSMVRGGFSGSTFLLASGPSAADFPLRRYAQYPIIAMNGSIVRCREEGIRPFFYLCDDPNFVVGRPELALQGLLTAEHAAMSLDVLQAIHELDKAALQDKKIYLLERVNRFQGRRVLSDRAYAWSIRNEPELISNYSLIRSKPNRIGFSLNLSKGYFGSRTVPFAGLQLACHLGFCQVFIIGMDLRQSGGRFYEQGQSALPSTLDKDFEQYILPSFKLFADKISENAGVRAFNLSSHSRMPESVLAKISLGDLDQLL